MSAHLAVTLGVFHLVVSLGGDTWCVSLGGDTWWSHMFHLVVTHGIRDVCDSVIEWEWYRLLWKIDEWGSRVWEQMIDHWPIYRAQGLHL